ncbi:hypothetical protein GJ744_003614 [Endocarpon pusillum]|uniref:Alpha/beta hydrolase fold-3 domain-containing protein n=1 Tax=Endocarpon pusillum TaxID=364733 RepID=A0A8H7AAK2_9EURO|nr:hypothetical protein GJ744_003614 [Endocarpon pusillum]
MAAASSQLSFMERIGIISAQLGLIGTLLYSAVTGIFRDDRYAASYKHHITHSAVRALLARLNSAQLKTLNPSFRSCYEKFCKEKNLKSNIVTFKSGLEAFWMGDPNAKYVFVDFHGGGYALDADEFHLNFWHSVQKDLDTAGTSVAWLFVAYSLTPHRTYPTQICEAIEALKYVHEEKHRPSSEIIIGGDSAGGALTLAILSHLSHPSPDFPNVEISGKFKAAVVIAPWVSFRLDWPSFKRNQFKDTITAIRLQEWASLYQNGKPSNNYIEPVEAPPSWWKEVQVEQMLCTAGGDEILLDAVSEWVAKYKSVHPDITTYVVGKDECHIAPIMEPMLMDTSETEQGKAIKAWLKARL